MSDGGGEGSGQGGSGQGGPGKTALRTGVVLAALLSFVGVIYLANFTGAPSAPGGRAGDDPFGLQSDKAKGKGKGKGKADGLRDEAQLWVEGAAVERPAAPEGAPNVVVVLMSAVRRDALEPYGAPAGRTPFLATFTPKGARFADALAAAPHPRGAEVALLTGQHAAALGVVDPGAGPEDRVLPAEVVTLAERFQAGGWATIGITANHNLNVDSGLAQGFDRYREAQNPSFRPGARIEAAKVVEEAMAALDARPEPSKARPFFLQLALIDAHSPLRRIKALEAELEPGTPNVGYRVAVRKLDDALRLLVDELDARGHAPGEDTLLVVVSEHGEGNTDPPHHGRYHGHLMYETSIGIPWIVVGPGVVPGRLIGGLASQTDVAPTVLDLAGLEPLPGEIDGRSWAGLLRGQGDNTDRERAFADTWFYGTSRASIWTTTTACQKDFGSAPAEGAGEFADGCYDRAVDPEFRNLKQDPALMAELEAWRAGVAAKAGAPAPTAGEAGEARGGAAPEDPPADPAPGGAAG